MPKSNLFKLSLICLLYFESMAGHCQYDPEAVDLAQDMSAWHDEMLGRENSGLVYGEYQKFDRDSRSTHAYYQTDSWTTQRIKYRGQVYDDVLLMYNTFQDFVSIRHPSNLQYATQPIKLIQDQISWFEYDNHLFRYYEPGEFAPGLYDELYAGENIILLKKRKKVSQTSNDLEIIYEQDNYNFIHYKNTFFRVSGRISWLRIFNEEKELKKSIKNFLRDRRISPRNAFDSDLIDLASFINTFIQNSEKGQQL